MFQLPQGASEIHHEVELGLVIGHRTHCISPSVATDHIGGYVLALDMTDRQAQAQAKKSGCLGLLCGSKDFNNFCASGCQPSLRNLLP